MPAESAKALSSASRAKGKLALDKGSLLPRLACLGLALGVTYVFFIQYCDLLFDCGCRALWSGRAEHCNIHDPSPPHCPWCVGGGYYGRWTHSGIVVAQLALALWPGRFGRGRAASVFLAFPALGAVAAMLAGLATGYWE